MNFSNRTKISRNTDFYLGAARGAFAASESSETIVEGVTARISSSLGKKFSQSHSYNYARSASEDSTDESNNYSGNMRYRFSKRLTSNLSLTTSSSDSESLTIEKQTDSLSTAGSLSYALGRGFSLSERINYTKEQTSSSDAGQSNLGDLTRLRVTTAVGYGKRLRWARLGAGYSIGYLEEKRTGDPVDGNAVNQNFSISLSGMDAMGYATVNASTRYSYTERLTGNLNYNTTTFALDARNKIWKKYISLAGSYTGEEIKSGTVSENTKKDQLSLGGSVLYFKKVRIAFGAKTENNYNEYDGKSTLTSKKFSIGYSRQLYNGNLIAQMLYMDTDSDFRDNSQKTANIVYSAAYRKLLLRRIPWEASLYRTKQTTDGILSVDTKLTNSFLYRLRAWSLGASHQYSLSEYLNTRTSETRIMLTASRSFIRRWL
jgi:hypothetical protein